MLRTERDFHDLAAVAKVHAQGLRHVEMFFDPQGHLSDDAATVIDGLQRAIDEAKAAMASRATIMCFLRHLDEADAEATLDLALAYKHRVSRRPPQFIRGRPSRASSPGSSAGPAPKAFAWSHAGEEGPPGSSLGSSSICGRGSHRSWPSGVGDFALVHHLVHDHMALTVCPLSNLRLAVVDDMRRHPLKPIAVTLNSDDPAYFGGYLNEKFRAVRRPSL